MWNKSDFDPSGDFESIVDGIEDISYYRFDPATDTYGDALDSHALCRELFGATVTLANGETTSIDMVFHMSKTEFELSNFMPRRLDKIEREENRGEDGQEVTTTYIVQQVRWSTF